MANPLRVSSSWGCYMWSPNGEQFWRPDFREVDLVGRILGWICCVDCVRRWVSRGDDRKKSLYPTPRQHQVDK